MLQWNFKKVFTARNVVKPYTWLVSQGISRGVASRMSTGKTDKISLKHLEKLCLALNCSPNDLLEWEPANEKLDNPQCALYILKPTSSTANAAEYVSALPLAQLQELAKVLREGKG